MGSDRSLRLWSCNDLPWAAAVQSYDGERCLYAALNDETRRVLLEHGFKRQGGSPRHSARTSPVSYLTRQSAFAVAAGHDLFLEFLERDCFDSQEAFPDVAFAGTNCHRFMLAASTPPSSKQCQ